MKRILMILLLLTGLLPLWCGLSNAAPKGTLIVADATGEPASLDPHMHYNTQLSSMLRQIYETLLDRDPDGKLIPALAESWKWIDKTTWQFNLRKGVRFHNGQEVTSEDVKFSIDRIISPETKSPQSRDYGMIDHIEVIDNHTLNIITKGPDPILPSRLVLFVNILPFETFKMIGENEFFKNPVGAGPFKFVNWDKGKEIVLEANEEYFRGEPKVKKVVFKFIAEKKKRIDMLLKGDLDIITNVMPQDTLKLKKHPRTQLMKKPSLQFYDVFLDTLNSNTFSDERIRLALNYATDVDNLIKYVHKGNAKRLATFTMPEEFGYDSDLKPYQFDLEKAKSLLEKGGYPSGFKVKMLAMEHLSVLATALKKQWQRAGIEVDIVYESREGAILRGLIKKEIPFDVFIADPTDPLFDASHQMTIHLDPKHPVCRFHNDEVTNLLYQSNITMDEEKRLNLLRKIQKIVYEKAPIVFLYQNIGLYGVRSHVVGFMPYADTMLRLHNVMISKD